MLTAIESSDEKDARLLQQQLVRLFNMAELRQLSFDLDVDDEIWPDEGKIALARNLVTYFQRRNHLSVLAKKVREERPDS